ncbi:50S ribosomal protein L21 [Patescibacteria group bacterium]
MYAIVEIQGKQYKVAEKDQIEVDRMKEEKGKVTFDTVLLYAKDDKNVEIGTPYINGAKVEVEVLEQTQGKKLRVFKMKPKKRYKRTIGHRSALSLLEIKKISKGAVKTAVKVEKVEELKDETKAEKE